MLLAQLRRWLPVMSRQCRRRLPPRRFHPCLESLEERRLLSIAEFPTPTANSNPAAITSGPDGNLWFTESYANKIGQVTPSGTITEFPIMTRDAGLSGITAGPDGKLWFTEYSANQIGRITPDGDQVTEYRIPTPRSAPGQILTGPDGNLWFTEVNGSKLGRLDPTTGRITEFQVPYVSLETYLTTGPDGNLWFTQYSRNLIDRMTPDGKVTEFPIPTRGARPAGITSGPDGNLWFAESGVAQIGRINPANGSVHEFPTYTHESEPWGITVGEDGNLWFTERDYRANQIGRMTLDGQVDEFVIPTDHSIPLTITSGPDCNLWFIESYASKIGRYYLELPATHFLLGTADSSTAGTAVDVTVTALDKCDRTVFNYTGTVHFTNTDAQATFPADYTFTPGDSGVHAFAGGLSLYTAGRQTITATDTTSGITGSSLVTVNPAMADHFVVSVSASVEAGTPVDITVTAVDPYGNVDSNYRGSITFTSSDADEGVVLPSTYTFTDDDQGMHSFAGGVTLWTPGDQTVSATDTSTGITGSAIITVA